MGRYAAARLAWLPVVLLGVSLLSFGFGVIAPGDPARAILEQSLGQPPTEAQVERMRNALGLDRPFVVQYAVWLADAARGDLGISWRTGDSVASMVARHAPRTGMLALTSAVAAVVVGLPAGVVAARRRNRLADHLSRAGSVFGASIPNYVLAYLLILVFAVHLNLLPSFGVGRAVHLILPAVTLAVGPAAVLARLTRSTVLDVLGEDHVRTAQAKGLRPSWVTWRHVLRNALIPLFTAAVISLGHLLGGSVIVEWIFSWPGLGQLTIDAIRSRDYPVVQGVILLAGFVFVVLNFLTDLAYGWLDPRVRLGGRR